MKNILSLVTLILLSANSIYAQLCSLPPAGTPQMGAMIMPQFSNLWKQATVLNKNGQYFKNGIASIGADGWTVDGFNHNFRFYWQDILPALKNGDIKSSLKGHPLK